MLPEHLAVGFDFLRREDLDRVEAVVKPADVADGERDQVLADEVEAGPFVPGGADAFVHYLRLIAVLDELEAVVAVVGEALVGWGGADGKVALVVDDRAEGLGGNDETALDAAGENRRQDEDAQNRREAADHHEPSIRISCRTRGV